MLCNHSELSNINITRSADLLASIASELIALCGREIRAFIIRKDSKLHVFKTEC